MAKRKSAAAIWARESQTAMNAPVPPTTRTRPELEAAIADISEQLKGPMDGGSRLDLVEARSIFRKQLELQQ
jgi:hypothetical protein